MRKKNPSQIGLFNVKVSMVAMNIPPFLMLCTRRHILFSYSSKRVCHPWMKPWMKLDDKSNHDTSF
jgi:hypothetical protein